MNNTDHLLMLIIFSRRLLRKIVIFMLLMIFAYLISAIYDIYSMNREGAGGIHYRSFAELMEINPDIAAWIKIDGTKIDHPVVHGHDNYEYLNKDFNGNDYAGGSIFLDADNSKDISDRYILIHGHHMSGGAMFGELGRFNEEEFFDDHIYGELLTPDKVFDLTIIGTATVDAYDSSVYRIGHVLSLDEIRMKCSNYRKVEIEKDDKLVALSTCSGDMSNNRTVVFARARYAGINES